MRTFVDAEAQRVRIPVLVALTGPSGTGKTLSALRLAKGIQEVVGGDIGVGDSEQSRALHYAPREGETPASPDTFAFRHVPFGAPFSPLDYLALIRHLKVMGCKTIVIDSMSWEHEGPGGVLEMHEKELERLTAGKSLEWRDKMQMLAWAKPKAQRRQLLTEIVHSDVNFILCFRAKQKLRMLKGKEPEERGWCVIGDEMLAYEMTLRCLLTPEVRGVPCWQPTHHDEHSVIKLPRYLEAAFAKPRQLDEDIGRQLAEWAQGAGSSAVAASAPAYDRAAHLLYAYDGCRDEETYEALEQERKAIWATSGKPLQAKLKKASSSARTAVDLAIDQPPALVTPRQPGEEG